MSVIKHQISMRVLFALLSAGLLVACTTKMPAGAHSRLNRKWKLTQLRGVESDLVTRAGAFIDLTNLSKPAGYAGCNRAMFRITTDARSSIRFSGIATTRVACREFNKVESAYTHLLPSAVRFKVDGYQIWLFDDSGDTIAAGAAAERIE